MKRAVRQLFLGSDPRADEAYLSELAPRLAETDAEEAGVTVGECRWQVYPDNFSRRRWMLIVTYEATKVDRRFALVEKACEAAIQGGTCGVWVSVTAGPPGRGGGGIIDAWPDERVPYGQRWEVPVGVEPIMDADAPDDDHA
jgi:hypothetical protein